MIIFLSPRIEMKLRLNVEPFFVDTNGQGICRQDCCGGVDDCSGSDSAHRRTQRSWGLNAAKARQRSARCLLRGTAPVHDTVPGLAPQFGRNEDQNVTASAETKVQGGVT
mmetsp:Transcript_307/g.337  ORF Transcript_307/g.337 Transcript_307/m.337 type:complete len:110 (-) Transcript_307:38-367(-)